VSLIVLPLILAALSRWAPRQRIVLGIFGLLLVLAISAQVLLGVLLQFDGATGPLYRFSPPDKGSAQLTPAQGEGSTLSRSSV
jgi:peptidoglycan/LPS O-acetylase OafA/YrhL